MHSVQENTVHSRRSTEQDGDGGTRVTGLHGACGGRACRGVVRASRGRGDGFGRHRGRRKRHRRNDRGDGRTRVSDILPRYGERERSVRKDRGDGSGRRGNSLTRQRRRTGSDARGRRDGGGGTGFSLRSLRDTGDVRLGAALKSRHGEALQHGQREVGRADGREGGGDLRGERNQPSTLQRAVEADDDDVEGDVATQCGGVDGPAEHQVHDDGLEACDTLRLGGGGLGDHVLTIAEGEVVRQHLHGRQVRRDVAHICGGSAEYGTALRGRTHQQPCHRIPCKCGSDSTNGASDRPRIWDDWGPSMVPTARCRWHTPRCFAEVQSARTHGIAEDK